MRIILFYSLMVMCGICEGQGKYDYNWMFGFANVETDTNNYGVQLSFNNDTLEVFDRVNNITLSYTNTTMSDNEGNLLFYTDGCSISNYLGETIENGDSINPGEVHDIQCEFGYTVREGTLSIPINNKNGAYFLFHQGLIYYENPGFTVHGFPLYATKIDMVANMGEGEVLFKNQIILEDTLGYGKLEAIKHANEEDWWLLIPARKNGTFYSLLVSGDSIGEGSLQETGLSGFVNEDDIGGQSVFSPDGERYIEYEANDGLYIYDFDRETGLVTFDQRLPFEEVNLASGCAVSSNSRFLYVNTTTEIYQYDLEAEDINGSKVLVAEYDGYLSPFPTRFFLQQLGPDCRIYITSTSSVDVLHVINQPNQQGAACEVMQHAIQLPWKHVISIPNFANFRTGSSEEVCDSTIALPMPLPTSIMELAEAEVVPVSVYPNPVDEELTIQLPEGLEGRLVWRLYDGVGREVMREQIGEGTLSVSYPTDYLTSGLYFYGLERDGVLVAHGKLMKH